MVAKSQIKLVKSLQQKKFRNEHGLFVVEGKKSVDELLASAFIVKHLYALENNLLQHQNVSVEIVTENEMKAMSALKSPARVLGVFEKIKEKRVVQTDWVLVLDGIRDPGNLGTIIRLCDWFDIQHLVCSKDTVDCYNPKVLQATMGSITRVNITYVCLEEFLSTVNIPVYGTFMNGESVYKTSLTEKGVLVMGNEGQGISEKIEKYCQRRLSIPQYGASTTESLNVATATAIFLNEIRRY